MSKTIGTLEDFADWLGTKDPRERYDYTRPTECAATQYVHARGLPAKYVNFPLGHGSQWVDGQYKTHPMADERLHAVVRGRPWTFGAARERALAALRTEEKV
jgi:hypothetical protein